MNLTRYTLLALFLMTLMSCSNDDDNSVIGNQITDPRDGQTYDIVTIGSQTWFAENLNYNTGDDGSECYEDSDTNCFIYGKLYRGDTAQTACPEGWHLPSVEEYQTLFDYLGGTNVAHVFLAPFATQQNEEIGFNLLAGGYNFAGFKDIGEKGYYYTSTDGGLPSSFKLMTYEPDISVNLGAISSFSIKQSCRCIKD